MNHGQVLCRVSEAQTARRRDRSRLVVLADLADVADDFAHPTLRAGRSEPPEGVAGLAGSPATGCTRLLPGGSGRPAQGLSMVHNSLQPKARPSQTSFASRAEMGCKLMPSVRLIDRATLHLSGEEAKPFLQNLVTADLDKLAPGEARPAALLTPQGKILFDFLVSLTPDGLRLDVAAGARGDLAKRLTLYKLRAKITIAPQDEAVAALWEDAPPEGALTDRRFPGEVYRLYGDAALGAGEDAESFERLRLSAGIAEAERDFPASDVFPHDVLLDQNEGVSFRKGCYVGQEVVSRMQHRGTARRRIMVLRAEGHLTPGAVVEAAGKTIGTVLSAHGSLGIGMIRIDKLADALRADQTLSADGVPLEAEVPAWAGYTLPEAAAPAEGEA